MSFEIVTVIVVLAIFGLFGIGAYKAEKAIAAKAKEVSQTPSKVTKKWFFLSRQNIVGLLTIHDENSWI